MAETRRAIWSRSGCLVVLLVLSAGEALASPAGGAPRIPFRGSVDASTRFLLGQALAGASARLGQPACQAVFSDFRDGSRRALDEVLRESGQTGRSSLGLVFFVDGADHANCRTGVVGAFTVPGSRVVRVCPLAVHRLSRQDPALVEALLIHELLHTLGLAENPPSTEEIESRVEARCLAGR